jgi:hypothetical protein
VLDTVSSSGVIIDPYLSYYQADKAPGPLLSLQGAYLIPALACCDIFGGLRFGANSSNELVQR